MADLLVGNAGAPFGVVLRLATGTPSLSVVRGANASELALDGAQLADDRHMIRVSISGTLSLHHAHIAAHSLDVYSLPNLADYDDGVAYLLWRYSFAGPGRFHLNFTADFYSCNRTLRSVKPDARFDAIGHSHPTDFALATEGSSRPTFCESVPHGATAVRATSYAVIRASNSTANQRCTRPVAISDLSDGWWQSHDGRAVAQSGQLRWHLRRCTQWQDVLDVEVREALAWWARVGKRTLYLVGELNSGKVSASWEHAGVTVQWVDVRPMAFALHLAPNESDHDGKTRLTPAAATAMGYGSASWVRRYRAYVSGTLRRLARVKGSAFAIGPNAHLTAEDDGVVGAAGGGPKGAWSSLRGACVTQWSRIDMATELLSLSQWPQREDRSSWRTAAANALARASAGAAYVDVFEPTLALHPWRTNVVHLELPSFAKAVYHELVPSMLLVALHRACGGSA